MSVSYVDVLLLSEKETQIRVAIEDSTTSEDVCNFVAKSLGIGMICRHLFSLRIHDKKTWLYPNYRMNNVKPNDSFDYRLRFRVPLLSRLKDLDVEAFNYYYDQVRRDVMDGNVSDISYDKHEAELLGLGVTDMYRHIIEEKYTPEQVEENYKKYIPKPLIKKHFPFIRRKIRMSLQKITRVRHDPGFIKKEYLLAFESIAPNYLSEDFNAQVDEHGSVKLVTLQVNSFHKEQPGIRFKYDTKSEWQHLCTIDHISHIPVRQDENSLNSTLEISRTNGIPSYFCFASPAVMYSFVSLLDGYYRLMVKWTFNLCNDIITPSLRRLYLLRCHGPVGGQFSYAKLEEKGNGQPGTYILRQSEASDGVYYLDVCLQHVPKPETFKIERINTGEYLFSYDTKTYKSITELLNFYKNSNETLELLTCLPSSEADKSRLLVCAPDLTVDKTTVSNPEENLLTTSPQIINIKDLQVFKGVRRDSKSGMTYHYRSLWKHDKRAKTEAAMKVLRQEYRDSHLNEFLELCGHWASIQSNSIVKLYGITLKGPISMVTEYVHHGPLDMYLHENKAVMKEVDLVEAGTYLAFALSHLEESGIVHGNIRCRKMLVSVHNEDKFLVKLCDPGLHNYTDDEVHWIPPECYHDFKLCRTSTAADVWAYGTTLWEIFAYGRLPDASCDKNYFRHGRRLPPPSGCPRDIHRLMLECWDSDSLLRRKKPQAIVRDINQILYQVFNSRRTHTYATAFPKTQSEDSHSMSDSNTSLWSDATAETFLVNDEPTGDLIPVSDISSTYHTHIGNFLFRDIGAYATQTVPPDIAAILSQYQPSVSSLDSDSYMESIYSFGKGNVILQGRIGQGFYGEVFKAVLESPNGDSQQVAVKKLKADTTKHDLEREISIMENLKHDNIVKIIGTIHKPEISLVMEYIEHGSLQTYLKTNKEKLQHETLLKFALDVATGMEYLGTKNIVHRDLASRNILVSNERHVKISDFGLAQVVTHNNYYIIKTNRELPIKWYAPESLRDGKYSHKSDVWSYGVTLYEMFSLGEDPKLECCSDDMDQSKLLAALQRGERLPCPAGCQTIYVQLMVPCWKLDSKERPGFTKLKDMIQRLKPGSLE